MKFTFDAHRVAVAPASPGVYRLYRRGSVVCVGMAAGGATIRTELRRRLEGDGFERTPGITAFDCEAVRDPLAAYRRFLTLYAAAAQGEAGMPIACAQVRWPPSPRPRVRKSTSRPEESSSREA